MATIDPGVLARVQKLHLAARFVVAGLQHGPHLAVQRGHEAEFFGYKPYVPPHPLKDVDWRAWGRTDRLVVRERSAERELVCELVLDASADLASTPAKWTQAVLAAAALAYAVLANGDPVGLSVIAGSAPQRLAPARGRAHLARILGVLASIQPAGRADLRASLLAVGERVRGRTLLGVVSDFMEDPSAWGPALGTITQHRVDVRALLVYDADELGLVGLTPTRLRSPETGRRFPEDPAAIRDAFAATVADWKAEVRAAFVGGRARLWELPAADSPVPAVGRWLAGK